jgi:hypothetical protein
MQPEQEPQVISADTLRTATFNRAEIKKENAWDKFGVGVSAACTIKCVGLPLITAALPSLGALSAFSHSPAAHWGVFALAAPGAAQLFHDGGKNERRFSNASFASFGLTLMAMGAIGHTILHGSGHDHTGHGDMSEMNHDMGSKMGGTDHSMHNMDHSGMDHSMHDMKSEVQQPAAVVFDPAAAGQKAIGDISHYSFLIGGLILGVGHLRRFFYNRKQQ